MIEEPTPTTADDQWRISNDAQTLVEAKNIEADEVRLANALSYLVATHGRYAKTISAYETR